MTAMNKRIFLLFLALLLALGSTEGGCGTINTNVTSYATILSDGQIDIKYEIGNTGDDTAHRVMVTTFLALDAQKSDDLGSNPPGGLIRYNCRLSSSDLKPGKYTLVARISFDEQSGTSHRVYHFSPLPYRLDRVKEVSPALSVELSEPYFSVKSFWQAGGKCRLSLKNNLGVAILPVVTLYLPDGFTTKEPERSYQLAPGEKREEVIPLEMDASVKNTRPFYAVAWYEQNGIHSSQWIEGKIRVEERPVYFKGFLVIAGTVLVVFLAVFFYRKRSDRK